MRAAMIADSVKKVPSNVITKEKLAEELKSIRINDSNVDSISWSKLKGIPAGFADGIDNAGSGSNIIDSIKGLKDSLAAHRNLINSKANASHQHSISDISGLTDTITTHRNKIASIGNMIKVVSAELKRLEGQVRLISHTTPYSWLSLTVNESSSGYMIVNVTCEVSSRSGEGITYWALNGGVGKNSNDIGEVHNIHWNTNTITLPQVWSQTKVFYFTSSEQKTVNLYFWRSDCSGCGYIALYNAIMTAIFVKDNP
ncbi:MAG: hypothetical protein N2053_04535 [Chitinispirillaceae bacterium]|nr:hypothetical protein [Chitinispirillaceae bacterium]